MIIVDADDFCEQNQRLDVLLRLKRQIPTFKITLFSIPFHCSPEFIREIQTFDWIDMVQHGWAHDSNYECLSWTKAECREALRLARKRGFTTRGFKAPGWQISEGCYEALAEEGYWVADQDYNSKRRRHLDLACYVIEGSQPLYQCFNGATEIKHGCAIHGHIGHWGGHNANTLELIEADILEAARSDTDFRFIREVIERP